MEETQDGFRIAEEDLKIRGPGDFIGTRQAGFPEMRSAGALTDFTLLSDARRSAFQYLSENPGLKGEEALVINEVLRDRWAERLNLSEIG
jgi:ATP-dependent DNA helicase RecG